MTTLNELSVEYLSLMKVMPTLARGTYEYETIGEMSGVTMNEKGKATMRRVLRRAGIVFDVIRGYGIKVTDPVESVDVCTGKFRRISRAIQETKHTHKLVVEQMYHELPDNEKMRVNYMGAIFAAMNMSEDYIKQIVSKNPVIPTRIQIPVIDVNV